jgi:uncharacterized membrane protein
MTEASAPWFDILLHVITRGLEGVGVAVIVLGAIYALLRSFGLAQSKDTVGSPYHQFRQTLGRAILLGLELLVAADIIGTVAVEPTLQNVLILALIVLIRTFLSISLTVEIENRWPWQKQANNKREPSE